MTTENDMREEQAMKALALAAAAFKAHDWDQFHYWIGGAEKVASAVQAHEESEARHGILA